MAFTQDGRSIAIYTTLGKDVLLLQKLVGQEGVSRLFSFQLDLLSEDSAIDATRIIGQPATIALTLIDKSLRYINGVVSRFARGTRARRLTNYRAEVVPWLWFLTRTADCRIFQDLSAPDIIEKIFRDLGFGSYFKNNLQGSFEPRSYCVQYRETDFHFVSRLMEEEGIFYFFEHEEKKHTLVLANDPAGFKDCPGQAQARFRERTGSLLPTEDSVTEWQVEQALRSGKYGLADFNFETPNTSLLVSVNSTINVGGNSNYEVYDYPGGYLKRPRGQDVAKIRMEEEEAAYKVITGAGNCHALVAGHRFNLVEHYEQASNGAYVLTEVRHTASAGTHYTLEDAEAAEEGYANQFTCIPADVRYRPPRVTRKPFVQGVQTAIVVGPSGEEIYTDKYGRVKVQFHWDREGQYDEKSSCWVRVAQSWAGKRWGTVFLPRIGQEVIVDFLEGDPDQPILVGSVYNAQQMPPYTLPDEKTKSTTKTYSSKGGAGFNEIRFEDKKGSEQIFIHGEKDEDVRIKNDSREWIGNERHLIVKKDQLELVEGDKHGTVKGGHFTKIEGDRDATIQGDRLFKIAGSDHLTVSGDQAEKIGGDKGSKVTGNWNADAGQKISIKAGMDMHEKAGMNYALDAGMAVHIKGGMTVVVEGGMQLSLKVGGNFIDINPGGVFIQGTMVMINSGGSAGSGGGSSPSAPAAPEAPDPPKDPKEADKAEPGEKIELPPAPQPPKAVTYSPAALVMKEAAQDGTPFCEECERARQQQAGGGGA
jgi:type VI secretion system secreted protein VgrG